ncbi:MAG: MFS transporter [Alphaproteobacteria bacterium]|nr:MFS transporter [Alphaproteobacteria bacterium]
MSLNDTPNQSSPPISPILPIYRFSYFSPTIIPSNIWALGASMCLINISVIMVYSLSALYMSTIGISTVWIGLLEGVVEATSFFMKLFSGILSDYLKKRKGIMLIGYGLTVISKPLIGMSTGFSAAFAARVIERLGNGIQATPRDALVGDVAPPDHRGACYGLQRSLGIIGSTIGAVLGMLAMIYTLNNFRIVFYIATIPAAIAFGILYFAVKEPKHAHYKTDIRINNHRERHPIHLSDLRRLGKEFWCLMIIVAVFMLARVSETLIVLDAHHNYKLPTSYAPLIMCVYNITYCLFSFPVGILSDRIGRFKMLVVGIGILMIADFFIFSATSLSTLFIGVLFWGCQMGIAQNTFAALISDIAPDDLRGTAFSMFYVISGISTIGAGLAGGSLAHFYGESAAFKMSFLVAGLAMAILFFFKPGQKKTIAISPKA